MEPSRLATFPARQPIARSDPEDNPADQVWDEPGRLRKYVVLDAAALLATCVVSQVKVVPLPVVVDEVQTAHPVGNEVPIELKFSE